jgi:hypothetical protein
MSTEGFPGFAAAPGGLVGGFRVRGGPSDEGGGGGPLTRDGGGGGGKLRPGTEPPGRLGGAMLVRLGGGRVAPVRGGGNAPGGACRPSSVFCGGGGGGGMLLSLGVAPPFERPLKMSRSPPPFSLIGVMVPFVKDATPAEPAGDSNLPALAERRRSLTLRPDQGEWIAGHDASSRKSKSCVSRGVVTTRYPVLLASTPRVPDLLETTWFGVAAASTLQGEARACRGRGVVRRARAVAPGERPMA